MVKKLLNPDQLVFSFLRDDPVYEASLVRSRIAREVERGLTTKLTDRLSEIIVTTCYNLIEETVERAVKRAVTPLQKDFQNVIRYLDQGPRRDPADWWKEGHPHDTDDEIPF